MEFDVSKEIDFALLVEKLTNLRVELEDSKVSYKYAESLLERLSNFSVVMDTFANTENLHNSERQAVSTIRRLLGSIMSKLMIVDFDYEINYFLNRDE